MILRIYKKGEDKAETFTDIKAFSFNMSNQKEFQFSGEGFELILSDVEAFEIIKEKGEK